MAEINVELMDIVNPNVEALLHFFKTGQWILPVIEISREELKKLFPDAREN